jgi:predicted dehydrogenase
METDPLPRSTRRRFLGTTAAAAGAAWSFQILPSRIFAQGQSPNEAPNLAFIGAGGRGSANIQGCAAAGANVYALADVDLKRCEENRAKYPQAKFYQDWRELLDKEAKNLDGIVVSTPDHTHAVAAMAGIKLGLHAYVEKPLTRTISEARALRAAAREAKVCTQMGNTGHASNGSRLTNEFVRSGALGQIDLVHCVTNRPIWPQGMFRGPEAPVPDHLDWDGWIGPAPMKPYAEKIAPFNWRGYVDYGTGALGDMGAHIIDHPVWAFGLGTPTSIEVVCDRDVPGSEADTHPNSCTITMIFPREGQAPLRLVWFDGKHKLPAPPTYPRVTKDQEGKEKVIPTLDNGVVYFGSKHVMAHGSHGGNPEILTDAASFVKPPETLRRSPGHYREWIDAIRAQDPSMAESNFEVAAHLTEILLLGALAAQRGSGTKITWDPVKMTTGDAGLDRLVHHDYRPGWSL